VANVIIASARDIEAMRVVGKMAAETLLVVGEKIRVGMSTEDIDRIVVDDTKKRGGICAPLNYHGFPKSVCTSVNDVVCHGIPNPKQLLKDGDIINVDVTTIYDGYHGDTSATFYVGKPSAEARLVTETSRQSLELGIAEVREGARLGDIGAAIEECATANGCSVVRAFVGHGIGKKFHDAPQVHHYGKRGTGLRLRAGMIFTIEPMINIGGYEVEVLDDRWTAVTKDGSLSAQFEHTIVVTRDGCEVLTRRDRPLMHSEGMSLMML
jgi:methionyl aminopeptidase